MMVPHRPKDEPAQEQPSSHGPVAAAHVEDRTAAAARAETVAAASTGAEAGSVADARVRVREWPVALVLVGVAISLVVVVDNHFRRGSVLLALSVLLAAGLRLLLPARLAGVLAVRSRFMDVFILGGLGTGLLVLALVVPPPR